MQEQQTIQEQQTRQKGEKTVHPVLGYLLAVLAALGWASGGLIGKWLMTEPSAQTADWLLAPLGAPISAELLSADRVLLAGIIMLLVALIKCPRDLKLKSRRPNVGKKGSAALSSTPPPPPPPPSPSPWLPLAQLALYGVFGFALMHFFYYSAIDVSNTSTAILIQYVAPVLIMLFSVVVLKERPTWRLPAGVILALLGASLVTGALLPGGLVVSVEGIVFALVSAVFFSVYSLMGKFLRDRFRMTVVLAYGLSFAALFWLVVLGPERVLAPLSQLPTLLTLLVVSVFTTILPSYAFLKALAFIQPANATMTCILEPFLVALMEPFLFHEMLLPVQIVGGTLVVIAVLIVLSADLRTSTPLKNGQM